MSDAILTRALTRDFGALRALDQLELSVPTGAIFGFLGPNGAGKTTTIRLLLGLLEPTDGSAEVLGHDVARAGDAVRAATGALLEHPGIYERLSAERNLDYFGRIYGLGRAETAARSQELLQRFGLWEARAKRAGEFSRGMKQKLGIARAMLHRPKLLFLDEPTAGLDPASAAALRDDLLALVAQEEVTIFLTTHNLDEAERVCALVGVIRAGKLQAFGTPAQLRAQAGNGRNGGGGRTVEIVATGIGEALRAAVGARPDVESATIRADGVLELALRDGGRPAGVVAQLVAAGAEVDEVRRVTPSLEKVYLELMEA